jgi:molybdate transport system ATP-binding protein
MENDVIFIDIEKMMHTAQGPLKLIVQTSLKPGELVALYGPSGAGKTTLLRILAGLSAPDKGVIRFGNTVWFDSEKNLNMAPQLRNTGFMFQDFALFPNMTVEQNIRFAQPNKNEAEIIEWLNLFGLQELRKRKPNGLSGGQKQRVALARALARKPQLLLLDEPLSALDAALRNSLQDVIEQTNRLSGITTLLVSHDLNEVFRLANRVICIENGKITRSGKPENAFMDNSISGKVQLTGQIARIEKQETLYVVTVITGNNQIIKVIAFENDLENLKTGDRVMVYSKAFNPIISKLA